MFVLGDRELESFTLGKWNIIDMNMLCFEYHYLASKQISYSNICTDLT